MGGLYALPSTADKPFLTNVFDDVETVADCLRAFSIAQQPEKEESQKFLFGQRDEWVDSLCHCYKILQQNCWCIQAQRYTVRNLTTTTV